MDETEQLRAQLQDAHLIIGEQTMVLRRQALYIEQLQAQIAEQNGKPDLAPVRDEA